MNAPKVLLALATVALVSACGPRLQQVKNYIPPEGEQGLACLSQADRDRNQCEVDNQKRLSLCHAEAEQKASVTLAEQERDYGYALEEYIAAERGYELAYADYREQQRLIKRDGELAYVRCSGDVDLTQIDQFPQCKRELDNAERKANRLVPPDQPRQPTRPSYDDILAEYKRECKSVLENCGALYDQAYVSCGGQIDIQTICVANCN